MMNRFSFAWLFLGWFSLQASSTDQAISVEVTKVVAKKLEKEVSLPGELKPYQEVAIHSKISGFVESIAVDRGSWVKKGELLVTLSAPEMQAQIVETRARSEAIEAQSAEASAKIAAAESTHERLKAASQTPGVVAGNDLVLAEKAVEAERARLNALRKSAGAAEAALAAMMEMEQYLKIHSPFSGVITQRHVHVGSFVGPSSGRGLLEVEQISPLRLVVAVPERYAAGIPVSARVQFQAPAFPGERFAGVIRRVAHSLDVETRTMPVEVDVDNGTGRLSPGMFAEVSWPVRRPTATLFVPAGAIAQTTERIFVIAVRKGIAEWVDVRRGSTSGNLIEVFGDLQESDTIVVRGTDEIRPGTRINPL